MIIKVFASGSKGNSIYLKIENEEFLIDIGISYTRLLKELKNLNRDINNIKLIITHFHSDHIKGLKQYLKKNNNPIYIMDYGLNDYDFSDYLEKINILEEKNSFNNVVLQTFPLSHDVSNIGLLFESENHSYVHITDTGYINYRYEELLANKEYYLIESNYDEDMLLGGNYTYYLKQRILSDEGHLSNKMATTFLNKVIGVNTKGIIFGHISDENNTYDLCLENALNNISNVEIYIAKQLEGCEEIND